MKIGIDATFTPHGGSLGHLLEFITELSNKFTKADLILYTKKENLEVLGNFITGKCTLRICKSASYGNFFRVFWGQFCLPIWSIVDDLDILFCPGNISPIIKTTRIKAQWIATVGPFSDDVYSTSRFSTSFVNFINKYFILLSGYTSNIVIHESQYSKELFLSDYKYPPEAQFLIECGKDNFYEPSDADIESFNLIADITHDDLLCVSHLHPYKNIERLIGAFNSYIKKHSSDLKLYIVGKKADQPYCLKLSQLVSKYSLEDRVIFTGMVTKHELRFAYSRCRLFIFPSLVESSGYTLIEAMACGAPILASDRTAIPFTCQNGAQYFDAYSQENLASQIEMLLADQDKLILMRENSLQRASQMMNYQDATHEFLRIVSSVK